MQEWESTEMNLETVMLSSAAVAVTVVTLSLVTMVN
jgi:hypothetical protein